MNKTRTEIGNGVWNVVSEPGDATRYDYIVIKNWDDYMFAPYNNSFRYPQKINKWEVKDTDEILKRECCNLYTIMECIRTIEEIENENG